MARTDGTGVPESITFEPFHLTKRWLNVTPLAAGHFTAVTGD